MTTVAPTTAAATVISNFAFTVVTTRPYVTGGVRK